MFICAYAAWHNVRGSELSNPQEEEEACTEIFAVQKSAFDDWTIGAGDTL